MSKLELATRSFFFYLSYTMITIGYGLLLPVCLFLPLSARRRLLLNWGWSTVQMLRRMCRVDYCVQGAGNVPNQACVVVINHQSVWETCSLCWLIPKLCLVAKKELLYIPVFGWGLALTGAIFIDRSRPQRAFRKIVKAARKRLAEGYSIALFPEGTRVPFGQFQPYNAGAAALARALHVPILPIAHNAGYCWPKGRFFKYPGTIQVRIGPPIASQQKSTHELNESLRLWIQKEQRKIADAAARRAEI